MNIKATGTFFVLLAVITGLAIATPSAFADHMTAEVSIPTGSSVPGCDETNSCFIPAEVTIDVGGEVTWTNEDSAAHTITAGNQELMKTSEVGLAYPGGNGFDSGLFLAGNTFSHKFEVAGTYDYFCMVHPWMAGVVTVQEEMEGEMHDEDMGMMEGMMTEMQAMSSDGSISVKIETSDPAAGEMMSIDVEFTDSTSGAAVEHINYDISATQNGETVLSDMGAHEHMGYGSHTTMALASADPVDVTVTIQGIGIDPPFTGPQGDVVEFHVVPEFGTIAVMILGVAIVSIIALSARSKLMIPKL